jgi:hypothetical protein
VMCSETRGKARADLKARFGDRVSF